MKLMKPVIHLNGTSAKSLVEDLEAAEEALLAAREKLRATAPNGRDYYISDVPGALDKAKQVYLRRVNLVSGLVSDLSEEIEAIQAQETWPWSKE